MTEFIVTYYYLIVILLDACIFSFFIKSRFTKDNPLKLEIGLVASMLANLIIYSAFMPPLLTL